MCACEEQFARRYLPHQIDYGTEFAAQKRVKVTLGFQSNICNACKGLSADVYPMAKNYGRTSKLARYYWREISFETIPKFAEWAAEQGLSDWTEALIENQAIYKSIEKQVKEQIKILHEVSPKYVYHDESQSAVIEKYNVKIVNIDATYVKDASKGFQIVESNFVISPEEFAAHYFERLGYQSVFAESVPFHVIFGVFTYLLIQDFDDPELQFVSFGDRLAFDRGEQGEIIKTFLPTDFGTAAYAQRRKIAIEQHFELIPEKEEEKEDLLWQFDYWLEMSRELRQYLWAHRTEDIEIARQIITVLPVIAVKKILRYLIGNYWQRYLGWSDLIVYNQSNYFFVEVKSSRDVLSEEQKNWIAGNATELQLPFKLIKIHRKNARS